MNLLKHYTLLLGLFLLGVSASQAQITVTGTVVDGDQFGLPGVTVTVKGTNKAVATDFDGNYTIQVPSQESVLTFSFVGMSPQEITVGSQTKIDVTMEENAQELDEVVVVGYGTVKKRDLTGAVSQLKPSDQDAAKVTSIDNLLQGKIAGLSVGASASAPGAASSVTIRGANSLRGDNQPLYVIDNIPQASRGANSLRGDNQPLYVIDNIPQASAGEFANTGNDGTFSIATNPLTSLNPADIESIEVLKDASATAIYGSRGANGVILITTKRGKSGKTSVTASASFTIADAAKNASGMNIINIILTVEKYSA